MPQDSRLDLYIAHRKALVDYAASLTGDRARGEDLVQDAFLRLVPEDKRGAAPPSPILNPIAYLYRIVRNLAWDQSRRRGTERRQQQEPAFWMVPAPAATPEQEAAHRQQVAQVAAILESLSENARVAVEMQRFGGYKLEEIARRLGVSVPTAHRLVQSALLRIAAALDDDEA